MAKKTKLVDRGIAPQQRYQVFTQADASAGDIIMVQDSLGRPAHTVTIEAAAAMTIRFNCLRTVYPYLPDAGGAVQNPRQDLENGVELEDTSQAVVTLAANDTFSLDRDLAITDIKIVSAAGSFEIFVA